MLEKKGITPKDYMKENRKQLKESQRNNRDLLDEHDREPEPLYKLSQFQNVPARVFEESNKAPYKQLDGSFLRRGENDKRHEDLTMEAKMIRRQLEQKLRRESEMNAVEPASPRKPPVFLDVAQCASKRDVDFISQNRVEAVNPNVMKFSQKGINSKSETLLDMGKHEEFGRVPAYLENRKQQWADEEAERIANAPDPNCPRGMMLMPERERVDTLETLKRSLHEAMNQLSAMPFVIETPSLRRKHELLESKIKEIENAIGLFSRQKVYIAKE